jgi:hypothetical protein
MTELAVKLYGTNPQGIPVDWPADATEIADGAPLPLGYDLRMTPAGYQNYRAARQAAFDAWAAANPGYPTHIPFPQAVFYTANSAVETESTKVQIPFNTPMKTSNLFSLQVDGRVRVNDSVQAEVSADVTAEASKTGSATVAEIWIEINGIPVSGTMARLMFPAKDLGISARAFGVLDLVQGQLVGVTLKRIRGSSALKTVPNGCRLRLRVE